MNECSHKQEGQESNHHRVVVTQDQSIGRGQVTAAEHCPGAITLCLTSKIQGASATQFRNPDFIGRHVSTKFRNSRQTDFNET